MQVFRVQIRAVFKYIEWRFKSQSKTAADVIIKVNWPLKLFKLFNVHIQDHPLGFVDRQVGQDVHLLTSDLKKKKLKLKFKLPLDFHKNIFETEILALFSSKKKIQRNGVGREIVKLILCFSKKFNSFWDNDINNEKKLKIDVWEKKVNT